MAIMSYRGRLAPTPTGFLHLGHGRTFYTAYERTVERAGTLVFRNEDLDKDRCRPEFAAAALEDLRWLGIDWQEGPDVGGPNAPYNQSERIAHYVAAWQALCRRGAIYPSPHSRRDVEQALLAPHEGENEPVFPVALRQPMGTGQSALGPGQVNWRFRVPDGQAISFVDGRVGRVERVAGRDFGDFLVWRKDGFPSYELAVVADDQAMQISEVVRGEDLLTSTARQLLLYAALDWRPPEFYHSPLLCDASGARLAKRSQSLSLRALREQGRTPEDVREMWADSREAGE
jgi:glutamyl/glutaminyl-tRNA synthetase